MSSSSQRRAFDWLVNDTMLYDYPEWRLRQRFALATLFYASGGETSWFDKTAWLSLDRHECDWYHRQAFGLLGVNIAQAADFEMPCHSGIYQHLWLNTNKLRGSLPFELFEMLPSLRTISLHANDLSGTLSPAIGRLSSLEAVSLASTNLFGPIPSEVGLL